MSNAMDAASVLMVYLLEVFKLLFFITNFM